MKSILYARFSPRPDANESESNATQLTACRALAIHFGWPTSIDHEFEDAALSGDDEERPGLWAAIAVLSPGDVLVVYKLDRLARSVYLSWVIEQEVAKRKARIVSVVGEGTASDSPEDVLVRRILQALAEYQKKAQAAITKARMRQHQANGRRMSSKPPYGWQADPTSPLNRHGKPGMMLPNDAELAAKKRIQELKAEGKGARAIAKALTAEGVPCRGRYWHHQTVQRILARG